MGFHYIGFGTNYETGLQVDWNPDGKLVWGLASRIRRICCWDSRQVGSKSHVKTSQTVE